MFIKGVLFKSISISFPKPDPTPSASALIKLPFSLEPTDHVVSPLTFLTFNVFNSSSEKSNTLIISAFVVVIKGLKLQLI